MTGKVYPESEDIYQDQAQVLFDYYRTAAEKIVSEEMAFEQRLEEMYASRKQESDAAEQSHKSLIIWGIASGVSIILFIISPFLAILALAISGILAYKQFAANKKQTENIAEIDKQINTLKIAKDNIRRNYQVERIGVAYVPVARRIQSGDRSYVVDYTGDVPDTEFSLTVLNQPDELRSTMDNLHEHIQELPAIESNNEVEIVDTSDYSTSVQDITLHDYMGTIDRDVRKLSYLIGDNKNISVSMPVILPTSDRYRMLDEFATSDTEGYPIVEVFDSEKAARKVSEFASLGDVNEQSSEDGSGDVEFFVDVMRELAQSVDMLSNSRTASTSQLIGYTSTILQNVLKASFDQYSPMLEAEEIERIRNTSFNYSDEVEDYTPFSLKESSRVRYDLYEGTWVADNGSRTAMPFGMHQVDHEVLMPVIGNLMQENRVERLRIYSDIQDQKVDYLNQWHRDTDDFFGRNRSEANELIQRMNESYAEFVESYTNYKQQSATMATMKASGNLADSEVAEADNQAEIIEGFQLQTNQARAKQQEFTEFMDRVREDIDQCAERFGHVEFFEASLRDSQARENARAMQTVGDLDMRRRRLASVSAYLAQHGEVPPEPVVSERLDEDFTLNLTGQVENEISSLTDYLTDQMAREEASF